MNVISTQSIEKVEASVPSVKIKQGISKQVEVPKEEKKIEIPFTRNALMEKLFSVMNCSEINPILAGYFTQAMQFLMDKRKLDVMQYIFYFREHAHDLVKHSYNKSISEIVCRILTVEDIGIQVDTGEEFLEEKQEIMKLMIQKMTSNNSIEDIINNSFVLCTVIDSKKIMMKEETMREIYEIAKMPNPLSLRGGLTVFITLNRLKIPEPPDPLHPAEEKKGQQLDFTKAIKLAIENMEYFRDYLLKKNVVVIYLLIG